MADKHDTPKSFVTRKHGHKSCLKRTADSGQEIAPTAATLHSLAQALALISAVQFLKSSKKIHYRLFLKGLLLLSLSLPVPLLLLLVLLLLLPLLMLSGRLRFLLSPSLCFPYVHASRVENQSVPPWIKLEL